MNHLECVHFWEVVDSVPFFVDIVVLTKENDVLDLVNVDVIGS